MKIGMMADMYKPYISGVTTYISLNKRYLEKNGHEVFIFTFGNGKYPIDEPNIIRSPGFPIKKGEIDFNLDHNRSAKALLRTMDIVHVHHPLFSGSIALRECRPNHIPIVFTNHTRFDIYFLMYIPGFLKKTFYRILKSYLQNFFTKIDTVIVPSKSMKNVVRQFGNDFPVEVEPHGMELEPFFRRGIARDRSEFGFQPDDILLIYVGRLWPEKNLPRLIKAFEIICRDWDRARLLVVGDGPDRGKLESLVTQMGLNSKVFFTGVIPFHELPPYYKAGDIFVTPSSTETFGLTVVEAMASGLPVVGIKFPRHLRYHCAWQDRPACFK